MYSNIKVLAAFAVGTAVAFGAMGSAQARLSGAIFTTTVDGDVVNGNVIYEAKEEVYLDGGPGPNAPASAAGLPEGDYYFQVTDPSGKDLLSSDSITCRRVHVNGSGVIDFAYPGTDLQKVQGVWTEVACQHVTGIDIDHSELGAITVQLYPYDDTPNPGGVYKVWMTPVSMYVGALPNCVGLKGSCNVNGENWEPGNVHGFIPSESKTDNYKVDKKGKPYISPELNVLKFHDRNFNGVQDEGEEYVAGWQITINEPAGTTTEPFTPVISYLAGSAGTYLVTEETPAGTQQTVATLDGVPVDPLSASVPVVVEGLSGETHLVVFGNVGLGGVNACKVYDRNGNGQADEGEPGIAGWRIELTGADLAGNPVGPTVKTTGEDGCASFGDLLPGSYTVTELMPTAGNWTATSDMSASASIESRLDGSDMAGTVVSAAFTNVCFATADFDTKGYWHNKNGLSEITMGDIAYVNGLLPYGAPSSYFDAGDEPFDGYYSDGITPVASAYNNEDLIPIANEGTPHAEVSQFLVDTNAGGNPKEQLAQQLLAFIFNSIHRLDDPDATVQLPDSTWATASGLIAEAIAIWAGNDAAAQHTMQELLNAMNNNDAVPYVPATPCAFSYD